MNSLDVTTQSRSKVRPITKIALTDENLEQVEQLSAQGLSITQIGNYFGMRKTTWFDFLGKKPTIYTYIERGKAKAIEKVTTKLMGLIEKNNLSAIMFYLKSQAGWSDGSERSNGSKTPEVDPLSLTIKLETVTQMEAAKIYQKVIEG